LVSVRSLEVGGRLYQKAKSINYSAGKTSHMDLDDILEPLPISDLKAGREAVEAMALAKKPRRF